jgi:hypothetical protein
LDIELPMDEATLEDMTMIDKPWEYMQQQTYFLPELE